MSQNIHPTAIIDSSVKLAGNVKVGPYSIIQGSVEIGEGTEILSHVHISGTNAKIGKNNKIYPFSVIGIEPQDKKFKGEDSDLFIGDNNIIREHVTIHRGTEEGCSKTVIGNGCLFMVASHVAHDCIVGDNVILANNATLAGHVEVGNFAIIGGLSAIHQFARIGDHAMIGGMSGIENDVMPYGMAYGERASLQGLNVIGLKRRNFSREQIHNLRALYNELFDGANNIGSIKGRISDLQKKYEGKEEVEEVLNFLSSIENRSICTPKK